MLMPTLFDIAAIIGLWPTGKSFKTNVVDENIIGFNKDGTGFSKYIESYHNQQANLVFDEEHVLSWLCGS